MKINLPIFKDEDTKDLSKLEVGFDSVQACWL